MHYQTSFIKFRVTFNRLLKSFIPLLLFFIVSIFGRNASSQSIAGAWHAVLEPNTKDAVDRALEAEFFLTESINVFGYTVYKSSKNQRIRCMRIKGIQESSLIQFAEYEPLDTLSVNNLSPQRFTLFSLKIKDSLLCDELHGTYLIFEGSEEKERGTTHWSKTSLNISDTVEIPLHFTSKSNGESVYPEIILKNNKASVYIRNDKEPIRIKIAKKDKLEATTLLKGYYPTKITIDATIKNKSWILEPLEYERPIFQSQIQFERGTAQLLKDSQENIKNLAQTLLLDSMILINIQGHTDSVGSKVQNKVLSIQRAQSVEQVFLTEGVPKEAVEVQGYGSEKPVQSNETEEGRAQNRRVELRIYRKQTEILTDD